MAHTAPTHQASSNHSRLQGWVDEVAALTQPDEIHWCDGSDEEYDQLAQTLIEAGTFEKLSDARRPGSYLALSDPADVARVEDRTFICSATRGRRRPDEQLDRARRDAPGAHRAVPRLDARPDDVRRAVLDGPDRLPDLLHRRAADRLRLRGRVDADHDPDGAGGARRARRRRRVRALPALGRRAARPTERRMSRGRATPRTSTSCTSPRRARSGRSGRATAATRCSARSASRCGSPR